MSSLKMTFSLTSLILIIAFGLIFVPVSVMAHEVTPANNGTGQVHAGDTPVMSETQAGDTNHGTHPSVTSITLKEGDNIRGTMAAVAADDGDDDTTEVQTFTLVIAFDQDVTNAEGSTDFTTLPTISTTDDVVDVNGEVVDGAAVVAAVSRVTDDNSKFEAVVTVSGFPSGTAEMDDETLTFRVFVPAREVFSLQTVPEPDNDRPGGPSYKSITYEFMLVSELPMADDTTAPIATITPPDMPDSDDNLVFMISFDEAVSGFSLSDIKVENGAKEDFVTGEGNTYTLTVTPTSADAKVTVSIAADAVMNGSMLGNAAAMMAYTPDGYVPSVTIAAADGTDDDDGKVIFTLNFSESPNTFSVASLTVTGAAAPEVGDLKMVPAAMTTAGYAATYTLTVTPTADATEVKVSIAAGVLSSGTGEGTDFFASAEGMHTVTPDAPPPGGLAEGETRDTVTSETEFTLSGMLKAGEFVVIAPMDRTDIDGTEIVIAELPNIQRFFAKGGTISLMGGTSDAGKINKSVVITEIMWGLNSKAAIGSQANYQWIELYNTDNANADGKGTHTPADADLSKYTLVFTPTTTLPKEANLSDQVSNVELGGWTVNIGSSGALGPATDAFSPTNLVSMYRNFKYADLTKVHNKDDAAKNRTAQLGVIPSGNAAAGWTASTANNTYTTNQLGSPGEMHFVGRGTFDATSVGRNAVVITEVGNNSNDAYDWVELTAIANTNLENYELQYIEGQNITVLAQFVKKELKAGEILVVLQSNPRNNPEHPVAAGKEWKVADADRDNTGTASLYHVNSKLKIPNDKGKALFVLRSAKDKKDHNNIVDLAGNSFITDNSDAYRTNLWPLRATKAGHGNVIDGDVEDFNSGRVYQRNDRGSGTGEKDWSVRGYTGIGYKRSAANNGQNGGTPGFDNGALQEKSSVLAGDAAVTISEIMYDRGDRNNLPQWIELYNASATQAINLNEWKLKIENDSDVDVRAPAVTIANLGGTIIPPNQTVLIVAYTTGRVSRGSQGRDDFPTTRIISLSGKGELEIPSDVNKRNYRLLSGTAFKLTLTEKGGGLVDTVGNMGADWDLPMAEDDEGRSSIIRRYDEGVARDGTMAPPGDGTGAWVLASTSELAEVRVNETYYGSPDDVGTPGYHGGGALPVSLSKFRPERLKDTGAVVIRWITESELNNAGFNILRSEKRDGEFTKLNTKLIAGQGTTSERTTYEYADTSAKPNVVYYYQIQDVSLDGKVQTLRQSRLKGNVSAAGKITTTWGELKALQ